MKYFLGLLVFFLGCNQNGIAPPPDNDGGAPADLAGVSCSEIYQSVDAWLASHRSCASSAECGIVQTTCGLTARCGEVYNLSAKGKYLDSLVWDGWYAMRCGVAGCRECFDPMPAKFVCADGICAADPR
jgi:hypothetical protein